MVSKIEDKMIKPQLTAFSSPDVLSKFYWLKKELYDFCRTHSLSASGSKSDLIANIKQFLTTGEKTGATAKSKNTPLRDSQNPISLDTKVVHYKNDTATRKFFQDHIGKHFHFNEYLRQFASKTFHDTENLTYGDLVNGWIKSEKIKNDKNYKAEIGNQFEYNQFIRDFFMHENDKTLHDAIAAWNIIKTQPGDRSYEHYKKLKTGVI